MIQYMVRTQSREEILFDKRCSLYLALAAARLAGNGAVAQKLVEAVRRYADDPDQVDRELQSRGLTDN